MSFLQFDNGAGALQRYTVANVYVNGSVLLEETAVSIERETGSHSINTIGIGYAGEAAGAPFVLVTVENAVPSTNFEFDAAQFFGQMQTCQFTINAAGKHLTFRGSLLSDNFSHVVNGTAKLSFKAKGHLSMWE